MNLRTTLSVATLTACTVAGSGAAIAEPPAVEPTVAARVVGDSVLAVLDHALFAATADGQGVEIRTLDGQPILSLPTGFLLDGVAHPMRYRIQDSGRALTLTPDTGLKPVASPMEEQLAVNDFAANMSKIPLGSIAGAFLGAAVGAVIGLGSCLVVGPACLATAPAAIGTFAGMGGLLGTLTAGGAAVVDGVWRYLSTVNASPGESMYAHQGGVLDPNGTGVPDAVLRMPPSLGSGSSSGSGS
ncbi:hypothetical protein ABZ412_05545 [Nocardia sp. NPDC005746]|uniref:hypothetical protein n=1 Tax=Nocardia sp. NPDC005746 TaxID=3157062 RepID=UPI0033DF67AA